MDETQIHVSVLPSKFRDSLRIELQAGGAGGTPDRVFLSGETQVLPISKFVVDTETGEVALVRNAMYPELEVRSVISCHISELRDTGSTGWKIIRALMSYPDETSKQWVHMPKFPDTSMIVVITETQANPGVYLIEDIFTNVWPHIARIE